MWAIVDVLGDAVTPEVASAWAEVYWLMANMLMNQERTMYAVANLSPETVWDTWRVTEKIQETGDVVTFVVAAQIIRVFMMLFAVPMGAKVVQHYRRDKPK